MECMQIWHKKTQKARTGVLYTWYKSESEEMFNNEYYQKQKVENSQHR